MIVNHLKKQGRGVQFGSGLIVCCCENPPAPSGTRIANKRRKAKWNLLFRPSGKRVDINTAGLNYAR